jgi:hypothetical protein
MIPKMIKVGTRIIAVSASSVKVGRDNIKPEKGEVILTPVGESPYRARWPMRLHSETLYIECVA